MKKAENVAPRRLLDAPEEAEFESPRIFHTVVPLVNRGSFN
jgi:hypothetical protein